jgi:hypothetical protein
LRYVCFFSVASLVRVEQLESKFNWVQTRFKLRFGFENAQKRGKLIHKAVRTTSALGLEVYIEYNSITKHNVYRLRRTFGMEDVLMIPFISC